jgi:hypothetical protein
MPETNDTTIPPAPRGKRAHIKSEWMRMAKMMVAQGIDPNSRIDLLESYIDVVCVDSDLGLEWQEARLRDKIAISRRFSALLSEKLRLRKLLLAPEIKTQTKALADRGK